jgi:hypothetical protein
MLGPILGSFMKYLPLIKTAGSIYANQQNAAYNRDNTAGGQMDQKIRTGLKYGIHPLESIGGNSSSTVIPMGNPLAGIQAPIAVDPIEQKTKLLALKQLEQESARSNSLLIGPLSLYEGGKDRKFWGINSHFFGYSTAATSIVYAANAEEALEKILEQTELTPEQKKAIIREKQERYQHQVNPGGPQP